jgi:hypothetical protein
MWQHLFQRWIRTTAMSCINTWGEHCGFKEFFKGEIIGGALKSGSPTLRIELWAWLTERLLTSIRKLMFCLVVSKTFCHNTEVHFGLFAFSFAVLLRWFTCCQLVIPHFDVTPVM